MQFVLIGLLPTVVWSEFFSFDESKASSIDYFTSSSATTATTPQWLKKLDTIFADKSDWWKIVGIQLCMTMLLSTFKPYFAKLSWPALSLFQRYKDRSWSRDLKLRPGDEEDDQVNTRC